MINRLALGTVQFGLPYGVSNAVGQVNCHSAAVILNHAILAGMDTLDTAVAYGESERCLGRAGVSEWQIVTKLPELTRLDVNAGDWVKEQVQGSLERLGVSHIKGLLLHKPGQLLGPQGDFLWEGLQDLKKSGVIRNIGYSVYEPCELDDLWTSFRPDIVQAPYSILDRQLSNSGWLQRLYDENIEIHVRSVFLQGLLLMHSKDRPKKFDRWPTIWTAWDAWLHERGITALQACIGFAMADPRISRVIVGVDTLKQLEEILHSTEIDFPEYPQELETDDPDLINPSRWNSF